MLECSLTLFIMKVSSMLGNHGYPCSSNPHNPQPNLSSLYVFLLMPHERALKEVSLGWDSSGGSGLKAFSQVSLIPHPQPEISGKDSECGRDPLRSCCNKSGRTRIKQETNTLSGVSREACLTKLKEKGGKKKPNLLFPLHLELQVTPKILAHGGYKVSHLSYSKTRAKPAHNWKHFFYMFMGKLSFSPSPSAAWN